MNKLVLSCLLCILFLISACTTISPKTEMTMENLPISFFDGQLTLKQLPPHTLSAGEGAVFVFDLNLPEENQYRVWIGYPLSNYQGNGNTSFSDGSPVLEHNATNLDTGSNMRPVEFDHETEKLVSNATGTATEWTIEVALWDGVEDHYNYLSDAFSYKVTWE
jgi:hypothetical protein